MKLVGFRRMMGFMTRMRYEIRRKEIVKPRVRCFLLVGDVSGAHSPVEGRHDEKKRKARKSSCLAADIV